MAVTRATRPRELVPGSVQEELYELQCAVADLADHVHAIKLRIAQLRGVVERRNRKPAAVVKLVAVGARP